MVHHPSAASALAGLAPGPGVGLLESFEATLEGTVLVVLCVAGGGQQPMLLCAPPQTTLAGLFRAALEKGFMGGGSRLKWEAVVGIACDGRWVGRLEATLQEVEVQSGSRIELLLGTIGGAPADGSGETKGEAWFLSSS